MGLAFGARLNRQVGWSLLVAGFACAAWLDPVSLGERDASVLAGSAVVVARYAQSVLLGMAFLQLLVAQMPAFGTPPPLARRAPVWLTALGAVVYTLGYALLGGWRVSAWLIPIGALLNFLGFLILFWGARRWHGVPELEVALPVICLGILLDAGMALAALRPELFLPPYIGPGDGVRLRMLRLARAAAIALPVLALLYRDLAVRAKQPSPVVRWGQIGMLCGAAGMPAILVAAALTSVHLKYLLALPADAIFAGTLVAVWLASRHARRLELWGWLLIAGSMAVGLLMGAYAFDGPLPAPGFLGAYSDYPRRLTRLAHAYAILLGSLCIFMARELDREPVTDGSGMGFRRLERIGVPLLVAGTVTTVGAIWLLAVLRLPARVLSLGPALVAAATVLLTAGVRPRHGLASMPRK
jgi:hypothetical protein